MTDTRKVRWIVRLGVWLIRALAVTWRMETVNGEPLARARREGTRVIFALWHGELLPLLWHQRGENVAIVISEHRDGEIIARIAESLGYATVRPDGPRGPARVFAPGAAVAAQRTGALIAPIRAQASRAWRLKSWDRFLIPKPFAKVTVSLGPLTGVEAASPREAADQAPRLQAILDAVPGS